MNCNEQKEDLELSKRLERNYSKVATKEILHFYEP